MMENLESGDDEVSYESSEVSEYELEELQRLRERLKDQSALIALLKERAETDKNDPPVHVPREQPPLQDALRAMDELRNESFREHERADALSRRFDELRDKFAEIVQIKDNYKDQVRSLELTLRQASDRQQAMCRPVLEAKDDQIANLKEHIKHLERQTGETLAQITVNGYEDQKLITELRNENKALIIQIGSLTASQEQSHQEKVALEENLKLKQREITLLHSDVDKQLSRNDYLRRTITERGEDLSAKDNRIAGLTVEVEGWRNKLMDSIGKYHSRTAEVDVDQRVQDLNFQLNTLREQLIQSKRLHCSLKSASLLAIDKERKESCLLRNVKSVSELIDMKNKLQNAYERNPDNIHVKSRSFFTRLRKHQLSKTAQQGSDCSHPYKVQKKSMLDKDLEKFV